MNRNGIRINQLQLYVLMFCVKEAQGKFILLTGMGPLHSTSACQGRYNPRIHWGGQGALSSNTHLVGRRDSHEGR